MLRGLTTFLLFCCTVFLLHAQTLETGRADVWKGFERININIDGHMAYYVKPQKPLMGNPWVWRASFPDWHTDMDSLLLARGLYVAYVSVDDQFGSPYAMQVWDKFYNYLITKQGFAIKVALEAVSRGGLYAYGWAKRNPDKVSCIYAETPVCDFKSWPGGKGKSPGDKQEWIKLQNAYHLTEAQLLEYNDNPIDNLEGLAAFKVPIFHLVGYDDKLVPSSENTFPLVQKYVSLGGPATVYPVTDGPQEMQGHHVPIKKPAVIADFIYQNSYPVNAPLSYKNYINFRGGIPNTYKVITQKKKATVGFVGGSITYNPGWREKVCRYLIERFPDTKFRFIKAAIPSLGSLPHAFRLQQDLLDSGKVDLMFMEAAVNDKVNKTDSLTQVRAMEGMVQHARKRNPTMDIIMMSFADPYKTDDYNKGKVPTEVANHELVAARYNLPSINLAKEVAEKIRNNEFSWNDDFKDIHPSPFGQELYFATIKNLFQGAFDTEISSDIIKSKLPQALNHFSFTKGHYYNIQKAKAETGWVYFPNWKPSDNLSTRDGFVNVPMLVAERVGSKLTLPFSGTAVGMAVVSGADAGIISYSIDNGPVKEVDLYTEYSSWLHLPNYILLEGDLKNGNHTLTLIISDRKNANSKGNACRIVNFFINDN